MDDPNYIRKRIDELEKGEIKGRDNKPDPISNSEEIRGKIAELNNARSNIFKAAKDKALAIGEYDREFSLTILKLKNGLIMEMTDPGTGEVIKIPNLPATVIPQIAKGIIWKKSVRKEEAEALYRAILSNLEAIKAELNGLQSVNRHLE
jgi:hypothetical protein